nr:MAG TPA: hypothetical protein [Caudoviricetes sp.]
MCVLIIRIMILFLPRIYKQFYKLTIKIRNKNKI